MLPIGDIKVSRVLLYVWITKFRRGDSQLIVGEFGEREELICCVENSTYDQLTAGGESDENAVQD